MEMTIEEAERIIKCNIDYYTGTGDYDGYVGFDYEDVEAFNTAIDTMHKYQKIQEKINALKGNDSCDAKDIYTKDEVIVILKTMLSTISSFAGYYDGRGFQVNQSAVNSVFQEQINELNKAKECK